VNEELHKELLSILRAMKDGAPGTWQALVEQRSAYCMTSAMFSLLLAAVGLVTAIVATGWARRSMQAIDRNAIGDSREIAMIGQGVFAAIAYGFAAGMLVAGLSTLTEAMNPLGRMLEAIR
jgi:hypothetical protein